MRNKISRLLITGMATLLVASSMAAGGCSSEPEHTLEHDEVYVALYSHLTEIAETPEAKQYIGVLFPPPKPLNIITERHDNLAAWEISIDRWPAEAKEAFENADWFTGDFEQHFSGFFDDFDNKPTWLVYDDGRVEPFGRALWVEADIDRLNTNGILSGSSI